MGHAASLLVCTAPTPLAARWLGGGAAAAAAAGG